MLVPDSVCVPLPPLVRPPLPDSTPEKLVEVLLAPMLRPAFITTEPDPASDPMVSVVDTVRVVPLSTVTALLLLIALPPDTVSPPPDTVVAPV